MQVDHEHAGARRCFGRQEGAHLAGQRGELRRAPPRRRRGLRAEGASAEGASAEGASAEGASAEGASAEGASAEGASAEGWPAPSPLAEAGAPAARSAARESTIASERMRAQYHGRAAAG
ncbi:hypothetical protein [Sorangium cellulosum]|uniref:hypothetical protein n=1 Tax=Sorangium cellulosum TaxID=56 RepID=UPI00040CB065|nr:hypothetical protein [Sorangium cellulosum]